jgi:hypothetical protein
MIQRLRNILLSLGIFGLVAAPVALPAAAYADATTRIQNGLACGSDLQTDTSGCSTTSDNGFDLAHVMRTIINIFSVIVGFIAVIMIIIGGVRYITSGGDSGNISAAKNTIIYAVIGLIIVALAQVLVHFVLNNLSNAGNS